MQLAIRGSLSPSTTCSEKYLEYYKFSNRGTWGPGIIPGFSPDHCREFGGEDLGFCGITYSTSLLMPRCEKILLERLKRKNQKGS
jgi:hypothetical protein